MIIKSNKKSFTSAIFRPETPAYFLLFSQLRPDVDTLGSDTPSPGQAVRGPKAEESALRLAQVLILNVCRGEVVLHVLLHVGTFAYRDASINGVSKSL